MAEKTYDRRCYMIRCLKETPRGKVLFWRADDSGYTTDVDQAGVYSAGQVAGNPGYYDNEITTRAIPAADVLSGNYGRISRTIDVDDVT